MPSFPTSTGSIIALERVLTQLEPWQPDHYLLLGDLLNHGPRNPLPEGYNPAAVADRLNELAPQIIAVRGNCDSEVDQMLLRFPITAPYNQLLVDERRWFVSHGHLYRPDEVQLPEGSLFLSGHTHVPVLEWQGERVLMNPGSICFPPAASCLPVTGAMRTECFASMRVRTGESCCDWCFKRRAKMQGLVRDVRP